MIKKMMLMMVLLASIALGATEEQTFTNNIKVTISNHSFNVTTENNGNTSFDCNSNGTHSFSYNFKKNVSIATQQVQLEFNNFSSSLTQLASTCNTIATQYGDVNRYYDVYTTCNAENEVLKDNMIEKDTKISELNPFKINFEGCNTNLLNLQSFNSKLVQDLQVAKDNSTYLLSEYVNTKSNNMFWGAGAALLVFIFWQMDRRKYTPKARHQNMPQR